MQLEIRAQQTNPQALLREYVERGLRFALSRFGNRVGRVTAKLRGYGTNHSERAYRLSVEMIPFGHLRVEERDPDVYVAIDRAARRVGRLFGQRLDRERGLRRGTESVRTA